ncbi:orotidine-5'-phosphate decarboxylase [Candidatus Magnetominusculus dajiuhuensis]|uniref:orotidine-5'-phosphate decarboxylase n=1 Tax=Candidatus Magnetominusculus dajiuhuensis TaxID=3137712 RepID=UPI003B433818
MTIEQAKKRLCLALDVDRLSDAVRLAELLRGRVSLFKIGFQLFTKEGPEAVRAVQRLGGRVFLDLKYHDIPNTVASAAMEAVNMGVYMFNVHASGGSEMMRAAVEGAAAQSQKNNTPMPVILAVTVLTSLNDKILSDELGVNNTMSHHVTHLAALAKTSGLDGVVASPREITAIRKCCGRSFTILTPGIRPPWTKEPDDQKRTATPSEAMELGANYIVVGRPILRADDPAAAADKILSDMAAL